MKNHLILSLFCLINAAIPAWSGEPPKAADPDKDEEKVLYALGVMVGRNLYSFNLTPADLKHVTRGLRDTAEGKVPQVDLSVYGSRRIQELQKEREAARAAAERKKSADFLAKAAKDKNAKVFPSGLIYTEILAGKGPSPLATDTIKAHYQGALINNTVFDSSHKRGQPTEFALNGVIPCWTEGIQKMKVGGKAILICPSSIAYGEQGNPPAGIPGGAALVFDVELVEIVKK